MSLFDVCLNTVSDAVAVFCALHIVATSVGRLAMMSWSTHRKTWQVIYFLLFASAATYLWRVAEGPMQVHYIYAMQLLATSIWFFESRHRWKTKAPDYMESNCPFLPVDESPPDDCPLNKKVPE